MARVLIVDDEEIYRQQLEIGLEADDHMLLVASSGREAIDQGIRFHPEVLITDWMLKDDIHGLHVAHLLTGVFPELRTILMTGFPSDHLNAEAVKVQVSEFLAKPFRLDQMREALAKALASRPSETKRARLAVIEVDRDGGILFANTRARERFAETQAGPDAARLHDLVTEDPATWLDTATERWVALHPRSDEDSLWRARSQPANIDGRRFVVLVHRDEPRFLNLSLIEMLLGFCDEEVAHWPLQGRVLVIDPRAINRKWFISMLDSAGAGCYAVESWPEAEKLLINDDGLHYVVIGSDALEDCPRDCTASVRARRPEALVIGTSEDDDDERFRKAGIHQFIQQPWRIEHLVHLIQSVWTSDSSPDGTTSP